MGGVELLGDRDKGDPVLLEGLHQPCEVQERPAQPVYLVDHNAVDPTGLDVGHEALQRRPLNVGPGESAVVVPLGKRHPALGLLAGNEGLPRLALGVEGIKLLLQALLGTLARVDGTSNLRDAPGLTVAAHHEATFSFVPAAMSPKKWNPFHWQPVTFRAMAVSER